MSINTLTPGATIGILGGGQLGRMTAMAAAQLGYRCHIFCPQHDSPAAHVSAAHTVASYDDHDALRAFADAVDVVTLEFENVPRATLDALQPHVPVYPSPDTVAVCQDRLEEKKFIHRAGARTTPYAPIDGPDAIVHALGRIGTPAVLKRTRFGYDGKGQVRIDAATDLTQAWHDMGGNMGILEAFVAFEREVSVIVARDRAGTLATFPVVENRHKNHILYETIAPAPISTSVAQHADAIARKIAVATDLIGVLAVELFVTTDHDVLVNELAPRPHNSGHWSIEGCHTSQFEQLVRIVCGLPLGDTGIRQPSRMINLLGDEVYRAGELLRDPHAHVHVYGKKDVRPGRKMGHVTFVNP